MSQTTPILDGAVKLYKRVKSPVWQCSFTVANVHHRHSTKKRELEEAKVVATDFYLTAKFREREGISTVTKTFKSVAEETVRRLQDALNSGNGKVTFKDYAEVIQRYFIPYFGKHHINKITYGDIAAFNTWRIEKFGKVPSHSTINTHNTALYRVYDTALEKGYVTQSQVPVLRNDGAKGVSRPDFKMEDYRQLYRFMPKWITQGKKGLITDKREILRDYVLFLANTGVRPGTETEGLKWSHIRKFKKDGVEYIAVTVNGKTGKREIVARHSTIRPLERLLHRQTKYKDMPLDKAIEKRLDAYVFALPDGIEVKNLAAPFKVLLEESGLLVDAASGQTRTLYSIRHFYITTALLKGITPAVVAKHCGTSIAMIDNTYSHITSLLSPETIAGKKHEKKPKATVDADKRQETRDSAVAGQDAG